MHIAGARGDEQKWSILLNVHPHLKPRTGPRLLTIYTVRELRTAAQSSEDRQSWDFEEMQHFAVGEVQ